MKGVKIICFFLLLFVSQTTIYAKSGPIWINGYVYSESADGKQTMIPFANVYIYSVDNKNKLQYYAMGGMNGEYTIRPYNWSVGYRFVCRFPGYKTKEFYIKPIPDKEGFSGNIDVNIKMEKAEDDDQISCVKYSVKELQRRTKCSTIKELIESVPNVEFSDNEIFTANEGSVRFFLNGMNPIKKVGDQIYNLPIEVVTEIEFYTLPEHKGFLYDGVLNLKLNAGEQAVKPLHKLKSGRLTLGGKENLIY